MNSQGLLSQDAFLEVTFQETVTVTWNSGTKKLIRTTGSFITDGFEPGQTIETDDVGNPGPFTIDTVVALEIVLIEAPVTDASASATLITAFVKVAEVISMNTPAGEPSEIDMSHLRSTSREYRNGLRDEGSISGEMNFVPGDKGQQILAQMQGEKLGRKVRITLPAISEDETELDGYSWTFLGLARGQPVSIAVDEKATRAFTIRVSGSVTEEVIEAA